MIETENLNENEVGKKRNTDSRERSGDNLASKRTDGSVNGV